MIIIFSFHCFISIYSLYIITLVNCFAIRTLSCLFLLSVRKVASVPEDASPGTFVGHVIVHDPDTGASGRFNCSVTGDGATHFRLERMFGAEYHLVTSSPLDREAQDSYRLGIECADGGPESLSSVKWLRVDLIDVNDHEPRFDRSVYTAEIYENNYNGKFVVQVRTLTLIRTIRSDDGFVIHMSQAVSTRSQPPLGQVICTHSMCLCHQSVCTGVL